MCEHRGCRSLAAIDELTREHDLVVTLTSGARTARGMGGRQVVGEGRRRRS